MIHHIVLLRLKEGVTRDDPRVQEAVAGLAALPSKIEGIDRWEIGWNFTQRPVAYDFGLYSSFVSRAALDAYGPHPAHVAVATHLREVADWVLCDYES